MPLDIRDSWDQGLATPQRALFPLHLPLRQRDFSRAGVVADRKP